MACISQNDPQYLAENCNWHTLCIVFGMLAKHPNTEDRHMTHRTQPSRTASYRMLALVMTAVMLALLLLNTSPSVDGFSTNLSSTGLLA